MLSKLIKFGKELFSEAEPQHPMSVEEASGFFRQYGVNPRKIKGLIEFGAEASSESDYFHRGFYELRATPIRIKDVLIEGRYICQPKEGIRHQGIWQPGKASSVDVKILGNVEQNNRSYKNTAA